jgi:protein SCO1/2
MTEVEDLDPFRARRRRVLAGLSLVSLIVGGAGLYAASRARQARQAKVIAVQGAVAVQLPQFQLRDQNDRAFTDQSLRGHAWVANFIFTSCTQTCPKLTARMKDVQRNLADDPAGKMVKIVSFTVDPENDTPSVLKAYAEKNGADPSRWFFVTGDVEAVKQTVTGGFKMTAERVKKGANEYDILHGNWFAYGDKTGSIRGFSQVESEQEAADVARDLIALERGETTASR